MLPGCLALAGTTGDRGPCPCAVGGDSDTPVIAAAARCRLHDVFARPGGVDASGGIYHRGRDQVHGHRPAARAGDRDVEVVPVASLRPGRQRRGAAAGAAAPAAGGTSTSAGALAYRDVGAATSTAIRLGREDL